MQLERDAGTRIAYGMVATYAFFLYFLGPVTPLIAEQLGVSLTLAGLTGVALAAGLVLSGLVGPSLIRRWGRRTVALSAAGGLATAGVLLAIVPSFPGVLLAVLVAAACGSMLMNVASAALSDRHGPSGPRALTEANAVAAWVGLTAPLLIGAAVATGLGWRVAALGITVVALALAVGLTRVRLPQAADPDERVVGVADTSVAAPVQTRPRGPLPAAFFVSLVAVVAAVGAEIALNFWGAVLIAQNTGVELAVTTATISAMIAGIAVGRTVGSTLTRQLSVAQLIYSSLGVALVGFFVVWLAGTLPLAIAGLFVAGLGLALLFPLTSSLAIRHAAGQTDRAIAFIAVTTGVTLGAAPFILGALAGQIGVSAGFLIVPALIGVGVLAVRGATRPSAAEANDPADPAAPSATTRHSQ